MIGDRELIDHVSINSNKLIKLYLFLYKQTIFTDSQIFMQSLYRIFNGNLVLVLSMK